MSRLEGTVLVSGGTGALGQAVVEELLEAGAHVAATWIVESERDAVQELLGDHEGLELVGADVTTGEGAAAAAAAAAGSHPPLSAAVCLVGGWSGGSFHEEPAEQFERMVTLNLTTAYRVCRAVLPAMVEQGGGSIVCVGAKAALEPDGGATAYATTKSAVLGMVRSLAAEYRDEGIRVNAVLPSVIDTPANREAMPDADHTRWVPPVQIARTIRFLCSAEAAAVSGALVPVYGRAG